MSVADKTCDLCGKSLLGEGMWTESEEYGDVHESCLEKAELGLDMDDE